jgi:hypothetical protein
MAPGDFMLKYATSILVLSTLSVSAQAADLQGIALRYQKSWIALECTARPTDAELQKTECERARFVRFTGSPKRMKNFQPLSREFKARELEQREFAHGSVQTYENVAGSILSGPHRFDRDPRVNAADPATETVGFEVSLNWDEIQTSVVLSGLASRYSTGNLDLSTADESDLTPEAAYLVLVHDPLRLADLARSVFPSYPREARSWTFDESTFRSGVRNADDLGIEPIVVKLKKKSFSMADFEKLSARLASF